MNYEWQSKRNADYLIIFVLKNMLACLEAPKSLL